MYTALVWLRKDLRVQDNPALWHACQNHAHVLPIYIHDSNVCTFGGAQRWWLHHSLRTLAEELRGYGLNLGLYSGESAHVLAQVIATYPISHVYWNDVYEPIFMASDGQIKQDLGARRIGWSHYNGSLLHSPSEIKTSSGGSFKVFTPFWNHCLRHITPPLAMEIVPKNPGPLPSCEDLDHWGLLPKNPDWAAGFSSYWTPGSRGAQDKLAHFIQESVTQYAARRNNPGLQDGTSQLSPHIHFGEISPWHIWRTVQSVPKGGSSGPDVFLSQLGWREFSYHLLYDFPELSHKNFKSMWDDFPWKDSEPLFDAWKKGQTGYPIIDAGMRQLWHSGTMHNRVRMIVASFLTKNLMIHWRRGAAWFMDTLFDADEANNSAGWQWVAGCGADAAPYFRIFNPILQSHKFDPDADYIKRWVPELAHLPGPECHDPHGHKGFFSQCNPGNYPRPVVSLSETRVNALAIYKKLKQE
jgi:deoxyribodipyrimidine photo-lyase